MSGPDPPRPPGTGRRPAGLVTAALAVALWAMLPPVSGPALDTEARVEIVDHLVPGVVVLVLALVTGGRAHRSDTATLVAGLVITLAGVWMTATHVPLLAQAARDEVGWGGAVYHTVPGLAVLGLGAAWSWRELQPGTEEDNGAVGDGATRGQKA